MVSLPSILERISQNMGHPVSFDWALSELASNNEIVVREFTQAGRYTGQALSYVTNLLNPKLIICDGPLMQASSFLFPIIQEQLKQRCVSLNVDRLTLLRSNLYPLTSCIGASVSRIQAWEEALVTFESTT